MATTIFEKYGGFGQVSKLVLAFYNNALESDILAPYFEDTDMRTLIDHQTQFIAALMGGPASYNDDTLARVHKGLAITKDAFDEMARTLQRTLEDFGIEEADVESIIHEIHRREQIIVAR